MNAGVNYPADATIARIAEAVDSSTRMSSSSMTVKSSSMAR